MTPSPVFPPADRFFQRRLAEWPRYEPVPLAEPHRPPAEYQALSAALGCPDLFLADAEAGPDQFAFAADLATEAARAGERVLVVAPTPLDVEAILDRLTEHAPLRIGRALAPGEPVHRLTPASATRTARAQAERVVADLRAAATAAQRLLQLRGQRETPPTDEATLAEDLRLLADTHAAHLARLDAEAQKVAVELAAKRAEAEAAPRETKKPAGVLARLKGLFLRDEPNGPPEPDAQTALTEALQHLEAEASRLAQERTRAEEEYTATRDQLIQDTQTRRLADLTRQAEAAEAEFTRSAAALGQPGLTPESAVALLEQLETEARSGRSDQPPKLIRERFDQLLVVVGTLDAVGTDPLSTGRPFDRLVLTAADSLGEGEFAHVSRYAARWVLIGDGRGRPLRPGRPVPFFRRLWRHLHRPACLVEAGRLVARLADVIPITAEPLADRPEIELRLGRDERGEPVLAEVLFPSTTTAAEAKAFLASELGEVHLNPCGPVHWHEAEDRVMACWPATDTPRADWADLGAGVREKVVGTGADCRTAAVTFDKAAGWTRATAEQWLADQLGPGPRTAVLARPTHLARLSDSPLTAGATS